MRPAEREFRLRNCNFRLRACGEALKRGLVEKGSVVADDYDAREAAVMHDDARGLAIYWELERKNRGKRLAWIELIGESVARRGTLREGPRTRRVARAAGVF